MNVFFPSRRFLSIGIILATAISWAACSSKETKEAYDKFYGKERASRAAEAVVTDSIRRAELRANREAEGPAAPQTAAVSLTPSLEIAELMEKNTCSVCHSVDQRLVGPAWTEIAKRGYSIDEMIALVYEPKPEHWPDYPPMAPLPFVPKEDIAKIGTWINSLQ